MRQMIDDVDEPEGQITQRWSDSSKENICAWIKTN